MYHLLGLCCTHILKNVLCIYRVTQVLQQHCAELVGFNHAFVWVSKAVRYKWTPLKQVFVCVVINLNFPAVLQLSLKFCEGSNKAGFPARRSCHSVGNLFRLETKGEHFWERINHLPQTVQVQPLEFLLNSTENHERKMSPLLDRQNN